MPRLFSSSISKSLVSSVVVPILGIPFGVFQARLYAESNVKGATDAVGTVLKLCGFNASDQYKDEFESTYRLINIPFIYIPFLLSTVISYESDAEKYYIGEVSPLMQWVKKRSFYQVLTLIGSVYKSMIQILSLYDFNQKLFLVALDALVKWIEIEVGETTLLATSSALSLSFALIAFVGVAISTYGFFSSRNAAIDGNVRVCGYEVGKKIVNSAVALYTLTNLVLYAKNMISPLETVWESEYSFFAPILGVLTLIFLIPYTWFNFKVYQKKVEQKLIEPSRDENEEEMSLFTHLNEGNIELAQAELCCVPEKRKFLAGACMATFFKASAQDLQTTKDSFFNLFVSVILGSLSFGLTFFYFFAFCQGARKEPEHQANSQQLKSFSN